MQHEIDPLIEKYWRLRCSFPSAPSGAQMASILLLGTIEEALLERIGADRLDQLRRTVNVLLELNRWPRTTATVR